MKKIIASFLSFLLLLSVMIVPSMAVTAEVSNDVTDVSIVCEDDNEHSNVQALASCCVRPYHITSRAFRSDNWDGWVRLYYSDIVSCKNCGRLISQSPWVMYDRKYLG